MPRTKYRKKIKNGTTYYFYRLRHKNLRTPRDLYGRTVTELEDKIRRLKNELDRGVTSEKAYFGDYMEKWLNDVHLNNKKQATKTKYKGLFERYVLPYPVANIQLKDLTALDIQEHYSKLVSNSISKPTLKTLSVVINPCIRYAFTQGKILIDFSRSIVLPEAKKKQEKSRRASQALSLDMENALIKACAGTKWEVFILTDLNSGLRRGEIMALTWDDIDLEKGIIDVNKTYDQRNKDQPIGPPKTENSIRQVPIPRFLVEKLKQHKVDQNKRRLLLSNKYKNLNLVFPNDFGNYMAATTVGRALIDFAKEIGLESLNLHDFRDTYATRLYEKTKDIKMVQSLLGHSDIATTANIYTHVSLEEQSKYVQILDEKAQKANE